MRGTGGEDFGSTFRRELFAVLANEIHGRFKRIAIDDDPDAPDPANDWPDKGRHRPDEVREPPRPRTPPIREPQPPAQP